MDTLRPDLVEIGVAAKELGVPKESLRKAAEKHRMMIYVGRALRLDRNEYQRLIEACRERPQEQGSTSDRIPEYSSSATPDARTGQQALEIAEMLKRHSRHTSPRKAQSPQPVTRIGSR